MILFGNMQNETKDRRKAKTIASLRAALLELILEKHYDAITVQDIIDRANVGRSTFYSHFRDKEDILISDWKRFLGFLADHVDLNSTMVAPVEGLMIHLKDFHPLYRALTKSGKTERLFGVGTEYLAEKIEARISQAGTRLTVPPEVCAHFLSLQIFGMLRWWLDRNMPYPPAEMGEMFSQLVAPGIAKVAV